MLEAILVAIKLKDNVYFEETLLECENLCEAADIKVVLTLTQSSNYLDPNYGLRKGKLEELKRAIAETDVKQVIFNNNLNTKVVSNLKDYLEVEILDRTSLILHIFSLRAKSKEAQIQTEIVRLKYDMPQLLKDNMDSDKQRGGTVNNRGAGETRSTIIRRKMENRIKDLKIELDKLETRKEIEYQKRNKSDIKKVALVGYTNAGKSSLMNCLLKLNEKESKAVLAKDQLFATLDTSARKIVYHKHEYIFFDTVGFVSDLPHELVEAFKSTLKAACYADLLINVMDVANENYELQEKVTLDTLKQIGANNIPIINVYNKADLIKQFDLISGLYLSCKENSGIEELLNKIDSILHPLSEIETILIPYQKLGLINIYEKHANFVLIENNDEGSLYQISGSKEILKEIKKQITSF